MENKKNDRTRILEGISELDDYVQRLATSNELGYDESFHKDVLGVYRELMLEIRDSDMSKEDKAFMTELVAQTFEEIR